MNIILKNKKYIGQCNALSYFYYKKIFKIDIFEDLENLRKNLENISQSGKKEDIVSFYEILIKLIYTLIYTKNQDIEDFEDWRETIKIEDLTEKLINKTIEIFLDSFTDEEAIKELEKIPNSTTKANIFPEHEFLKMCLDYRLTLQDLKSLTYIDVVKIFLSANYKQEKSTIREATQSDIDRLLN